MKLLLSACFLLWHLSLLGQSSIDYHPDQVSKPIRSLVKKFDNAEQVESKRLYASGTRSRVYPTYQQLLEKATTQELVELTNHPHAITRTYAFKGLKQQLFPQDSLYQIALNHLKDTVTVRVQSGCIGYVTSVGDFMLSSLQYIGHHELSTAQEREVDSLLFWSNLPAIEARDESFINLEQAPKNYARLRKIVTEEKNPEALLPLLHYKKEEDAHLIREFLQLSPKHAIDAHMLYPGVLSAADLRQLQENKPRAYTHSTWIALYQSALSFPVDSALSIFFTPFREGYPPNHRKRQAQFIFQATENHPESYLVPVKMAILPYLSQLPTAYFEALWDSDSTRVVGIINERFKTKTHPYWQEDLIHRIVDKMETYNGGSAIDFINQGIQKGYSSTYYTLALRARDYANPETEQILMDRFNHEPGEHDQDVFYRAQGILNYDRETVYRGVEQKVFEFLAEEGISRSSGSNIIHLALKCNRQHGLDLLLKDIETNQKSGDFLRVAVTELIGLEDPEINRRLIAIYHQGGKAYQKSPFGKRFTSILEYHKLI